jgi:hypothetical protein
MAQIDAIVKGYAEAAAARVRRDLGHISSERDWERRERNRQEIEAERAADPWPWLEELLAYSRRNGSQMTTRWDPPPVQSHKGRG